MTCDPKAIPIFINARDLVTPLRQLINWLLTAGYHNLYILDNASTYPPLLEYYGTISEQVNVIELRANVGHTAIWDLRILDRLGITSPFVYSDPDIVPIAECPTHVIEYFLQALHAYPAKSKVGFGLAIHDLPDHYQFKQKVVVWESQFWDSPLTPRLFDAPLDTTFALYRPGAPYDLSALRTNFPYLARHAPWYEDSANPSDEQSYYVQHAKPGTNNWSANQLPEWLNHHIQRRADALSEQADRKAA